MINQATLLGRVGKIDNKTSSNGLKISNLSIVTSKKFTKDGEKQESITWHNVTLFSKLAEIAEKYVGTGDLLYVQGEIAVQKYKDANGVDKNKHYIIGHDIKMMPRSKEHMPVKSTELDESMPDDVIPF